MAQAVAINIRRRILGSRIDPSNDIHINSNNYYLNRSSIHIDRRSMEKIWKQMDRIVKYCQIPKMNLKNSPPYMLDILPDFYQTLKEILTNYEERLHILNDIEYFRIFIENIFELCMKTNECFKRAGNMMYDEQSTYRKDFIKFSLYFSHNLTELKSLFNNGIYEGEKFRLTKQEAKDFWTSNFNDRIIVPWEEFKDKLDHVHSISTYDDSVALQNIIDLTNNNHVSIFEFDVFTRLFHPWSSLLTNWKLLAVNHPGYMAFMTYDEVKAILTKCINKPGSYLFRLSCTRLGQWVIGYVTTQNTILQTIPHTKPLIQSLIDGEREGYYKYPLGKSIHIDLSAASRPTESDRIHVSKEQYTIYSDMGTSFELCKICSANNKNSKIQPCGHLLCQNCLISWQNQNSSKLLSLCPFCRGEIKGFEPVIINPFDNLTTQNKTEFDEEILDTNSSSDIIPPPIPPRPINLKTIPKRFSQSLPPPLHNNSGILLVPQRPVSSISSNDSLSDSLNQFSNASEDLHPVSLQNGLNFPSIDQFQTIDDVRNRLISENNFDQTRIEAVLILTQGLILSKQYELSKLFLNQVKSEHDQL